MADNSNPLQAHGFRLAMIALAAILAVKVGLPTATSPGPSGPAESYVPAPEAPKEVGTEDVAYLTPLCNFMSVDIPKQPIREELVADIRREISAARRRSARRHTPYKAEFLIVTVPDPQLAGTDYLTDALLESVRRSIELPRFLTGLKDDLQVRGPILDRYWLPWNEKHVTNFSTFGRGQPGMLLFRQRREFGFIGVLVVGEHPGMGLDREAMQKALELVDSLQDAKAPIIRILGPTFTGSQESLARELSRFQERRSLGQAAMTRDPAEAATRREYAIFNGSATSLVAENLTEDALPAKITYRTTIIPDRDLEDYLLHYLAGEPASGGPVALKRIAFLVESDTGYGQSVAIGLKRFRSPMQVMVIPFPLNVSRVLAGPNLLMSGELLLSFSPCSLELGRAVV